MTAEERTLFGQMTPQEQEIEKKTPVYQARYKPVQNPVAVSWQDATKILLYQA